MVRRRSSKKADSVRSLLSLVVLLVGAAASLGTSYTDTEINDDDQVHARLSDANPIGVWRMDVNLNEEAAPADDFFNGGEVNIIAGGPDIDLFESGDLALYVIGDPSMTDPNSVFPTHAQTVSTHLHCARGTACVRTIYLVIERRDPSDSASIALSAFAKVSYGKADEAPSGATVSVDLTELTNFSSISARTDRKVIPRPREEYPPSHEYAISVTTKGGEAMAGSDVIGYAAAWGSGDFPDMVDLFDPDVEIFGPSARLDITRFDPIALTDAECLSGSTCTIDLRVRVHGENKLAWWTEARLIFLDQESPPEGAALSMEVQKIEE